MVDIIHRVGIKAPVSKVYGALSTVEGVAGWWTTETTGVSQSGGEIDVRFLTPEGKRVARASLKVGHAYFSRVFEGMGPGEMERFISVLTRFLEVAHSVHVADFLPAKSPPRDARSRDGAGRSTSITGAVPRAPSSGSDSES